MVIIMGDNFYITASLVLVILFLSILVVWFAFYYIKRGKIQRVLLDGLIGNRTLLVVEEKGNIVRYSERFAQIFPFIRSTKNLYEFSKHYENVNEYLNMPQSVIRLNDKRYLLKSEKRNGHFYIEANRLKNIVNQGSEHIRRSFGDWNNGPLGLIIDKHGKIISMNIRMRHYWMIFSQDAINALSDFDIPEDIVFKFIEQVQNGTYVNGSLTIDVGDTVMFSIKAMSTSNNMILVNFNFADEVNYGAKVTDYTINSILDQLDDGLMMVDNFGKISYVNDKMKEMLNTSSLHGSYIMDVMKLYDSDQNWVTLDFPLESSMYSLLWLSAPKMERRLVVEVVVNEIHEDDGFRWGYILNFRDTTVRESRQVRGIDFAYMDAQTNTYNRHFLKQLIYRFEEDKAVDVGLILVDLNGLKVINDAFGHLKGDEAIIMTANTLKESCKDGDFVVRLGGDEFMMILTDVTEVDMDKYLTIINQSIRQKKVSNLPLSFSVGTAHHSEGDLEFSKLLNEAELAMYHNKTISSKTSRHQIMEAILFRLVERHPWEGDHSKFVSELNGKIANAIHLGEETVNMIIEAGKYHNIGKIVLEDNVHLEGNATDEHREAFDKHNEAAFRILSAIPEYSYLGYTVLSYKESYDGTGIPKGLSGKEIPLSARILRISSAFHKYINPGWGPEGALSVADALDRIEVDAGTLFDPWLVKVLRKVVESEMIS